MAYSYNPRSDGQSGGYDSPGRLSSDKDAYYRQSNSSYNSRGDDGARQLKIKPPEIKNSRSWPPPPNVEDETQALSREHPALFRTKSQDDGVQMRGAVDQEPILVEVENQERRFVLVPETSKKGLSKSDDTHRGRPSSLKTNMDQVDDPTALPRRQRTPYSFTPTPNQRTSGEYFLSPDSIPSSAAKTPRSVPMDDYSTRQPDSRRPTEDSNESSAPRSRTETSDDSDLDPQAALKQRSKKKTSRVSESNPSDRPPLLSPRVASGPPRSSRTPSPQFEMESRKRDSPRDRSPRATVSTNTLKPVPVLKTSRSDSMYSNSPTRHGATRSASSTIEPVWPPSPPRSPNLTTPRASNDSSRNSLGSRPGSRPNSRPTSPASSPLDDQLASASSSGSQKLKTKLTPLSATMQQESLEELPKLRTDIRSPQPIRPARSTTLPYPEDDHNFLMPTEADFSPAPRGLGVAFGSLDPPARPQSEVPPSATYKPKPKPSSRPDLPSRHSLAGGLPKSKAEPSIKGIPLETKKEPSPSTTPLPVLPPCPRKDSSRKYDDWYTIQGCETFNACPTCLDEIVLPSPFRKHFKRAPPRPPAMRTTCDFSSPWVRLAWLISMKQQRADLGMLKSLASVASTEAECPGAAESAGIMYGIALDTGAFVPSFAVCAADRRTVETLFPSLAGCLTRVPAAVKIERVCALRASSKRFPRYLDALVAADAAAAAKPKPDLAPVVELAKALAYKAECQRDRILVDAAWHFPAALPDLTVCEECFDDLVRPRVKKGPSIADRFCYSLQTLPPGVPRRASCQLYSARMRRVWERAADKGDWDYLKRKVRERRKVEAELREQQQAIMMLLTKGGGAYATGGGVDKDRLKKELDRIEMEWADWE